MLNDKHKNYHSKNKPKLNIHNVELYPKLGSRSDSGSAVGISKIKSVNQFLLIFPLIGKCVNL